MTGHFTSYENRTDHELTTRLYTTTSWSVCREIYIKL